MTVQVVGYTVKAGTVEEPELFVASVASGISIQLPGVEDALWAMGDEMKAFLDGYYGTTPANSCSVVRHEKEDVVLTHP